MLVSHRHHAPALPEVRLELDRAIGEHLVLRRVRLEGLVHDERLFGATPPAGRCRLLVVLAGRVQAFTENEVTELVAGDAIATSSIEDLRTRSESAHTFEVDWDPDTIAGESLSSTCSLGTLGASSFDALHQLSRALREATPNEHSRLTLPTEDALRALASEGLPFGRTGVEAALATNHDADQALFSAVDRALCLLDQSPDTLDVVSDLDWSRRTLSRRLARMNQRYRVHTSGDWRSQRDFYRVLVGSLLLSHPKATTRGVARSVGYRSPEALCHAFSRAGLPSPGSVRDRVRP